MHCIRYNPEPVPSLLEFEVPPKSEELFREVGEAALNAVVMINTGEAIV